MERERTERILKGLEARGLTQMLVCDPTTIWYLTGYMNEPYERFFALYLSRDAEPALVCNRLFPDATSTGARVLTYSDTDDPLPLVASLTNHAAPLGVDKKLPARWLLPLMDAGVASAFVLSSDAADEARSIKDIREQELMRRSSATNDEAMAWLAEQVHVGVTEEEIAAGLVRRYRELGAEDVSFTPIVSFGAHAADPHHSPDSTPLAPGDEVLFDVGCRRDAYCSDMTRTFAYLSASEHLREVHAIVCAANEAAEKLVAPGVTFAAIDAAARDIITKAGYGEYFTHRLGHQIGLEDHEPGDVSSTHDEPVRPGMCFSIEPGIYLPGELGVRIEDLVIVTEDGCEVINRYPKGLRVLG